MKATKGTTITCPLCGRKMGAFYRDVAGHLPVTSEDVEMDGDSSIPSHQDGGRKWSCQKDNAVVAELSGLAPSTWKVHTTSGWIA